MATRRPSLLSREDQLLDRQIETAERESAPTRTNTKRTNAGRTSKPKSVAAPPAAVAPPPAATPGPNPYTANRDALDSFRAILTQYGLESLTDRAFGWMSQGLSETQIYQELRNTSEYKYRFSALETLTKKGRAISENEYVEYERQAVSIFRQAGLPSGFYDQPEDFAKFIGGEVSLKELQDRVSLAQTATFSAPREIKDQLKAFYGIDEGQLTAYFLDPDKTLPILQQQYAAGEIASTSTTSGYGTLTKEQAESLALEQLSSQQIEEGFGTLAASKELFQNLPGQGDQDISIEEQLGAAFRGDVKAQQKVRRRAEERKGVFDAGGGFASSKEGITGLQ